MINKANENLNKAIQIFQDNEKAFSSMNLKLHDASYYAWSAKEDYPEIEDDMTDIFYLFCEVSYDQMLEYFEEQGYDFENRSYIGHTSSFYLDKGYQFDRISDMDNLLYNVIEKNGYAYDITPEIKDGKLDETDEWFDETSENIQYIASDEFLEDLNKDISPIIGMYEYIKDFKENQVEYFKEFLEYKREEILYEKEQKEKHDLEVWLSGVEKIVA